MSRIAASLHDLHRLDLLAKGDSPCHRLDPRAKVATTLVFMAVTVSFGRYEIRQLLPFLLFPAVLIPRAGLPWPFLLRKTLLVFPVVVALGLCSPLFDRVPLPGFLPLTTGWLSFLSVLIRSFLCVLAALVLVATTGMSGICAALERFGLPAPFVTQLMLLYRYLFVLGDEGVRVSRARELRSCGCRGMGIRPYCSLLGHLLLRTWQRADRVHRAMLSRGFTGEFREFRGRHGDLSGLVFFLAWSSAFLLFRFVDLPLLAGTVVTGGFR